MAIYIKSFLKKISGLDRAEREGIAQREYGATVAELERAVELWEASAKATQKRAEKGDQNVSKESVEKIDNTQFSVKNINGKEIVWVENSNLSAKQLNDYKAVADYIATHIGEVYTLIESGQKVYIGDDLPNEYTQSKYTTHLKGRNRVLLVAKNKVTSELGLMIETATNRRWEKTKHTNNKDAKYGMYRYDSSFAFLTKNSDGTLKDVKAFDVEILIRNASDGRKYLYDIVE